MWKLFSSSEIFHFSRCSRAFGQLGTMKSHEKTCKGDKTDTSSATAAAASSSQHQQQSLTTPLNLPEDEERSSCMVATSLARVARMKKQQQHQQEMLMLNEDNSLSVMAGSEPPMFNTDTLDSVRAACM